MGQVLLLLVVALTVAAVVFGVAVLVTGGDPGLDPAEPDGRAVPLPGTRPLQESDVIEVRFDTAVRGYRMAQVDEAMRRTAYDIGYKDELIGVLEAEVAALREGRTADADELRRARDAALALPGSAASAPAPDRTEDTTADRITEATEASEITEDTTADRITEATEASEITEDTAADRTTGATAADETVPPTQAQAERP